MRIVLLSDTHLNHIAVPEGDLLIHAGDITCEGSMAEVARAVSWLSSLPHPLKVLVAGNHDRLFEQAPDIARRLVEERGIVYLQDQFIILSDLRIWGSPWQPEFCNWAFNLPRNSSALAEKWAAIPERLDILITHGPPAGVLDFNGVEQCGCIQLRDRVLETQPKVHVFGHIHPSHGIAQVWGDHLHQCDGLRRSRQPAPLARDGHRPVKRTPSSGGRVAMALGSPESLPSEIEYDELLEKWKAESERRRTLRERDHRRMKIVRGYVQGQCQVCGLPIFKANGTANRRRMYHRGEAWETRNCREEYSLAAFPSHTKFRVWERDRGRCASCGRQCSDWWQADDWEADHTVPLVDGGGFGMENLQTLCKDPCHRAKTAKENRERRRR